MKFLIFLLLCCFPFILISKAILNTNIIETIKKLEKQTNKIDKQRKTKINELANLVVDQLNKNSKVNLVFICTHNSRRSHISHLWAIASSVYFGVPNIFCYSAGTEVTAFNPRAIKALQKVGFIFEKLDESSNPKYNCIISETLPSIVCFSKRYDDNSIPQEKFIAVMVCSDADQNCPYIPSAEYRFSLNYEDPKKFDNTSGEEKEYFNTVELIGRELVYLFKTVKQKIK